MMPKWFLCFNVIMGTLLIYGGSYFAFITGSSLAIVPILCGTAMQFVVIWMYKEEHEDE